MLRQGRCIILNTLTGIHGCRSGILEIVGASLNKFVDFSVGAFNLVICELVFRISSILMMRKEVLVSSLAHPYVCLIPRNLSAYH